MIFEDNELPTQPDDKELNNNASSVKEEVGAEQNTNAANDDVYTEKAFIELISKMAEAAKYDDDEAFYSLPRKTDGDWEQFFTDNLPLVVTIAQTKDEKMLEQLAKDNMQKVLAFKEKVEGGYYDQTFIMPQTKPNLMQIDQANEVFSALKECNGNNILVTARTAMLPDGWRVYVNSNEIVKKLDELEDDAALTDFISSMSEDMQAFIDSYNQDEIDAIDEPDNLFTQVCKIVYEIKSSGNKMALESVWDKLSEEDKEFFEKDSHWDKLKSVHNNAELVAYIKAISPGYCKMYAEKVLQGMQRTVDKVMSFFRKAYSEENEDGFVELLESQPESVVEFLTTDNGKKCMSEVMNFTSQDELEEYLATNISVLSNPELLKEKNIIPLIVPLVPKSLDFNKLAEVLRSIWQVRQFSGQISKVLEEVDAMTLGFLQTTSGKEVLVTTRNMELKSELEKYIGLLESRTFVAKSESDKLNQSSQNKIDMVIAKVEEFIEAKHDETLFENAKRAAHPEVLSFIKANQELFDPVLKAKSEEEQQAALELLKVVLQGMTPEQRQAMFIDSVEVSSKVLKIMKDKWSYVEVAIDSSRDDMPDEVKSYLGSYGVPIIYTPASSETKATIAYSRMGPVSGVDAFIDIKKQNIDILDRDKVGEDEGRGDVYNDLKACVDIIKLTKKLGHKGGYKILQGEKEAMRSFWALTTAHGIGCEGYEPDEQDKRWLDGRLDVLKSIFPVATMVPAQTNAPGMSPGGVSGSSSSSVENEPSDT